MGFAFARPILIRSKGCTMPEPEPKEAIRTVLSILIALAATTGALISWHASRVGGAAGGADGKAIAAALNEARTEISNGSDIFAFQTATRQFQLHRDKAKAIHDEAFRNPAVPDRWLDEWQGESMRAKARAYQLNLDFLKTENGRISFDRDKYDAAQRAQAESEKALDPAPFVAKSERKRGEAILLLSLNALFTAAIFFFTIGLKTDLRFKRLWTAIGILFYLGGAGIALWRIFFVVLP
jgi:hypothetical protein